MVLALTLALTLHRTGCAGRARGLQVRGPFGLPCGARSLGARATTRLRLKHVALSTPIALRSSAPHRRPRTHPTHPVLVCYRTFHARITALTWRALDL